MYGDQMQVWKVRFIQGVEGEEHEMEMLPYWENRIIRVREAFGREMIPDESRPTEDGVIFVKSADGTPPYPTFERIMTYTLGEDPTEYRVRIHGGDSPATIREGLKRINPGKNPEAMWFEGGVIDDGDPVGDWFSRTGKSDFRVNWMLGAVYQKFWLWTREGEVELGDEEWDGRPQADVWQSVRRSNSGKGLQEFDFYRMFDGKDEIFWQNHPKPHVVLVPRENWAQELGVEYRLEADIGKPLSRF
jgi:hypothetical protein